MDLCSHVTLFQKFHFVIVKEAALWEREKNRHSAICSIWRYQILSVLWSIRPSTAQWLNKTHYLTHESKSSTAAGGKKMKISGLPVLAVEVQVIHWSSHFLKSTRLDVGSTCNIVYPSYMYQSCHVRIGLILHRYTGQITGYLIVISACHLSTLPFNIHIVCRGCGMHIALEKNNTHKGMTESAGF